MTYPAGQDNLVRWHPSLILKSQAVALVYEQPKTIYPITEAKAEEAAEASSASSTIGSITPPSYEKEWSILSRQSSRLPKYSEKNLKHRSFGTVFRSALRGMCGSSGACRAGTTEKRRII